MRSASGYCLMAPAPDLCEGGRVGRTSAERRFLAVDESDIRHWLARQDTLDYDGPYMLPAAALARM
jgi:hypothetical protein